VAYKLLEEMKNQALKQHYYMRGGGGGNKTLRGAIVYPKTKVDLLVEQAGVSPL
jgi:hypothetical protein